ncbi:MAG: VPDSG-CTERM sorting domain-containing protein [Opitutales bacterium]
MKNRVRSVPDTGSTATLLGVGVIALAAARRRLG